MARTKVFAHKGIIGINSAEGADGLLNNPARLGQLGFILDAAFVDVSPDALELLKTIKQSQNDSGDIDVFKAHDGRVIFCWRGTARQMVDPTGILCTEQYDAGLLTATTGVVTDPEFVAAVEAYKQKK